MYPKCSGKRKALCPPYPCTVALLLSPLSSSGKDFSFYSLIIVVCVSMQPMRLEYFSWQFGS